VNRSIKLAMYAALPVLAATACTDFLTGGELEDDPNRPTAASVENLFNGVQATTFLIWNGDFTRTATMWMQQMAGTGQQYLGQGRYEIDESTFDGDFEFLYNQGGLIDNRKAQALARESNDSLTLGILQVYEAYNMGNAASIWGALPYSQAANPEFPEPILDAQSAIYAAVQTLLDQAIVNLGGAGAGPLNDLNFAGNVAKWRAVANTLKARFYMHWVEAQAANVPGAAVACGGNCVQKAHAAALLGITSSANDFKSRHTTTTGEKNVWYQFIVEQRPGYMNAGKFLVDLLTARNDPRLTEYFVAGGSANGVIIGATNGTSTTGALAQVNPATRLRPDFSQPLVTWAENQLILAEAEYRGGGTLAANEASARNRVNAVRAAAGYNVATSASGTALLTEIINEKYISMFQSFEVWNDYKRTCLPRLPFNGFPGDVEIPGRLYYGVQERQTNSNVPDVAAQDAQKRNENDPAACTFA
jgi:starch-binding outer membrane protein, SusD/RagB family